MRKLKYLTILIGALLVGSTILAQSLDLRGRILLQVEKSGEAWYVNPVNQHRYYLGRPQDAFDVMRRLGLGAKHDLITGTEIFPKNLSGRILLDVESNGEAYYIYPGNMRKYYLGRPQDAFDVMRELGLGISETDIISIPIASLDDDISEKEISFIDHDVPFVAQAPLGNWSDQRQQDGCEEASALMAVRWFRSEGLGKEEAVGIITDLSDYLLKTYGEYRDISAKDSVEWIFKDYFDYQNVFLKKGVDVNDIVAELEKGNLVITPLNGRLLGNPYFTPPGPPRHMLVIRGYDSQSGEFITNDPGTRRGEAYRYDKDLFFNAIRDYPTGYHEYIEEIEKNIIVVEKEL